MLDLEIVMVYLIYHEAHNARGHRRAFKRMIYITSQVIYMFDLYGSKVR